MIPTYTASTADKLLEHMHIMARNCAAFKDWSATSNRVRITLAVLTDADVITNSQNDMLFMKFVEYYEKHCTEKHVEPYVD